MPAHHIQLVEPVGFCSNPETVDDNAFQSRDTSASDAIRAIAHKEFANVRDLLVQSEVAVSVFHPPDLSTPDALYPNNWFSTHEDGTLVLYPMKAPNRRRERRPEFIAELRQRYTTTYDLTTCEEDGSYLEGTGSLVLDRTRRFAFAAISERTDAELVGRWAGRMQYRYHVFHTHDAGGKPYYHTNVILALGEAWAVWCPEVIPDPAEADQTKRSLEALGKELIPVSRAQVNAFCANILEIQDRAGRSLLAVSTTAWKAFREDQRDQLGRHCKPLLFDIPTIERIGGGGIRCMLAELY